MISDVPSPIDVRLMRDASEWEATALEKWPWRTEFFATFANELASMEPKAARVVVQMLLNGGMVLHRATANLPCLNQELSK